MIVNFIFGLFLTPEKIDEYKKISNTTTQTLFI
jgi:hypothetical protein